MDHQTQFSSTQKKPMNQKGFKWMTEGSDVERMSRSFVNNYRQYNQNVKD